MARSVPCCLYNFYHASLFCALYFINLDLAYSFVTAKVMFKRDFLREMLLRECI